MPSIKNLLLKIFNTLTRAIIPTVDMRNASYPVNTLYEQSRYTPDFSKIRVDSNSYYWTSFANLQLDSLFYKIEKALIIGNGILLNKQGKVILESTLFQKEYLFKLNQNHLILGRFFEKKIQLNNLTLSLSNSLEDNYYHWIIECLTRVLLIENIAEVQNLIVVINDQQLPFKIQSLHFLFGIPVSNIQLKSTKDIYQASVIIPSFTHTRNSATRMTDVCHPVIIRNLNKKIIEKLQSSSPNKFPLKFILSRKKASDRRIINEEYLIQGLLDKSFKVVETENLSFEEQVHLFFHAQFVVTTHGAGLVNIIFSKAIKVIELFPAERNFRDAFTFTQISAVLGFDHHVITYQPENENHDVLIQLPLINTINNIITNHLT